MYYSGNILKPSLDLVLFTSQLSRSLGFRGTVLLFANYYATIAILRAVTPAFGRLAATEAKLEGEYRTGMGRLARESEEIAYVLSYFPFYCDGYLMLPVIP
jgi:ATP-binding cassette subfamily D (ALD) long-chain fatty acid import protein